MSIDNAIVGNITLIRNSLLEFNSIFKKKTEEDNSRTEEIKKKHEQITMITIETIACLDEILRQNSYE